MDLMLVVFKEDGQRREFPLLRKTTTIGRGEECKLQVPLAAVSRRHCRIVMEGNTALLSDLQSTNGTYLNEKRVTSEETLTAGDQIRVGPVIFIVLIDGEPRQIKPVRTILGEEGMEAGSEQGDTANGGTVGTASSEQDIPVAELVEDVPDSSSQSAVDSPATRPSPDRSSPAR
jgi:pSer/pThr/pTyr-binding forkhead associated (FHA) protein